MKLEILGLPFVIAAFCVTTLAGCHRNQPSAVAERDVAGLPPIEETTDKITTEIWEFRLKTRSLYNASKFDELEALAAQIRADRTRFGNGSWKIAQFYESLACRSDEPESMWQLHERIHENWDAAKPRSITASVAHAGFLIDYAWHARGSGYSNKVTKEGWRLFAERLAKASEILEKSINFNPKCPVWWRICMTLAKGQGWSREDFEKLLNHNFGDMIWLRPDICCRDGTVSLGNGNIPSR
ncbi:MAG TPA: DUF4034 domain-containing protein [Candidatus Udaeobacter sp.]